MGQSVCKCCNCTSSQDAKRRSTKIYPQRPLSVDCVWTQGSSLPSSIHRRPYLSSDSDFHSMETSMGEDDTYLKKSREDVGSSEIITEIFLGSQFGGDSTDELPLFLKKLKDITVRIGTNSRLLVELECRSDFKVTWYRNDNQILASDEYKLINEGNIYALEFTCVSIQDNGHWTCSAESRKGRVTSSCYLQVIVPKSYKKPVFYEELEAVLTDEGTVSLQCKVVGVPTPVLRWFKDGSEIKAGDIFALVANSRDPISLGTYTCEASNCMGKVYSSSGVKVNSKSSLSPNVQEVYNVPPAGQPPIFIQELKNEKLKIGESFILSSKIAVPPWPKAIKWQNPQDQYVDTSNPRYKDLADGLGGYMLEIISSEECDRGTWKCVAVSGDNSTAVSSCDIQLAVPKNYRKPYFVEKLRAVLTEDGLVSFECKVVGYPTPHLRWFKDGSELKAGDIYQLTGVSSLGSYLCIAKNCMGEAKSEAELTIDDIKQQLSHEDTMMLSAIRQPPKFIKKLISSEAPINSPFKFTVQVQMPPSPKLSWYRDDNKLEIDGKKYTQTNETQGVFHLNVLKLEFEDQAEWKCVASNEFGRAECSSFLKLIIPKHFKKPKFLENLRAVLTENGIVNLECKVIGVPQPTLKWFKDGVELNPGDIHKIMSGQDGTCCLGLYTCEAHNCMGSVTSSASIHGIEDATPVKPKLRKLSLSTINEEDTFRTADDEQSLPIDQPHELSYSFDGKEISVSYYDTPDLTQEEAIQIIEMYADQLSEHISEHNVLELPPLRIVKETSTASNILMEGVVIDIVPEYFTVAEDDLRTEVGIEDISVIEDTAFSSQSSGRLRLNSDSKRSVDDKNYEIRSFSESIQSPDLYYSLSESKKDDLSLPVSPVSRMSVEPETETYMSAKSGTQFDRRSSIKKTYFQDSPDRPQSTTGQSHTSEETGDIMPDDDSILRHNFQFLTVLLSNNLTDIQQRLCYIEREMFLNSLKQQSDLNESNFKDIGGLIQSIQGLRKFFLSFKQKKNGDFPYSFMDLNHIAETLQTNIDAIHTSIINNPNLAVQKNNVKIVYQVGETLVNVLDLISDIIKLDTFELCKTNVTQTEKQKLINMVLDTRDELNELVIVTHDLFIDTQDVTVDITDTRKTVDTVDEIMLKLDTDETSNEGLIQEQFTKTLGSETQGDETVPADTKEIEEVKIIEKIEIQEEKKIIEKQVEKQDVTATTVPSKEIREEIEEQLQKSEARDLQEEMEVEKQETTDKLEINLAEEKKIAPEKAETTLPVTKDDREEKNKEKTVIEIDISLDKKEVIKELISYQEEKIQDTLFDIDLVKPLFETISELKSPEINVTELFENQTVKNVLINILDVEKDIIDNQLKEIRLMELDETDLKKISEFENNKTVLKNQLGKITELENTLAKEKIPEKDVPAKEKIKKIISLEWLEQKQSELKTYLQTINQKRTGLSEPQKVIIQEAAVVTQLPPKEHISESTIVKQDNELQILNDLVELYDLQNHYSTITNDQLWDLAQEFQQNITNESYEIKLQSIENKLQEELNQHQLKQFSSNTSEKIAIEDTISDLQDQILDIKVKKFALYLVSDLNIHKIHPQSTETIYKALLSELPQVIEHKKHKINLELEFNADTFLNKLKQDFLEIEELKNYSETQSKVGKKLIDELKSICGKYNLNDLDSEEMKLLKKLEKITKEKEKQPQNKVVIEDEKSIQQEIYNVKLLRILEKDLKAIENTNLTIDPIQVLENKHDQIINSINLVKQTLNQKVLNLNDLKSYTKNVLPENNLQEIIQNVSIKQKDPDFEAQLHSDEINLDIQANEIKSQILFLEESLKESTDTEDKDLGEKHLSHLKEEYTNLIQKLMHTQISQLALEKSKGKPLEATNISPIIDFIEEKQNTLKTQLSELNTLESTTGAGLSSQLDLTNDEKIVILKKLQTHFANISKTEKFDFLNEISTNYNKEEYVANLNKEIEKLTSEMHEINIQKVSVKNNDQIKVLEANEQSVENKLLHAKIKQLAIAKLCELQDINEDITEDLKNIETIIPNILQEQEVLIKSEIDYSKPKILQDFQISQHEDLNDLDILAEQQNNITKLKEHFTSVIKNEISEIVEELASNYKNKGDQYAEILSSEEIQIKDKINDLKLQKYNIELLSDSTLEGIGTKDSESISEKVKVIDTEISSNETKLLTSQAKKLALAKVTKLNTQTEKLEDLFEDALLSLPNTLEEEETVLQAAVKTKAEILESVQTSKQEEIKDVITIKQQIVEKPNLQEIDSVEVQQQLEKIHKLKQYFENVVANDMSEIVEELISNSKDVDYATELKVDEVQIKGKINYLAKWQTYNLEKLSTIPLEEAEDISQKESILEKVNTLQQEINLNEAKLLKTQVKIMALAKLEEIVDKSKPLEDLYQDALLSIPDVLQEEERLIYTSAKVETSDVKSMPESKKLAVEKKSIKLREQIKTELNNNNEDILKLRQHTANFNDGEINKIVEEVSLNAKDKDDYTKRLKSEEDRLKERIKDLKWQRYNLERLSNMSADKSENQNDILETAKILEHEISYNETKLLNTQIKKMMLANVAEVIDNTENLTDLFQDVLLNLATELQNEELISKPTVEVPSVSDSSVTATKEKEQSKPQEGIKPSNDDKPEITDKITISVHEINEIQPSEHVDKVEASENKETEDIKTTNVPQKVKEIAEQQKTEDIGTLKPKEIKDTNEEEVEKAKQKTDDSKAKEIISTKETIEAMPQPLEKKTTDDDKLKEVITTTEAILAKSETLEKKKPGDDKTIEISESQLSLTEKKKVEEQKEKEIISTTKSVEDKSPVLEKPKPVDEKDIIPKKETIEEKSPKSEKKKTDQKIKDTSSEEAKETDLDKLQSIAKLKEHFATVTKYEIEEVVEELISEAKDSAYAEKLDAEEERLKCRIDDLKWQQNYLVRLSKIPTEEFDDVSDKGDIVRKIRKLDREIASNEEKLLNTQIKKLAFAQVKSSKEVWEKLDDLFEDALLNIPNILREEERILKNATKPNEDVQIVSESKITEELQQKSDERLEIVEKDADIEKSKTKLAAVEKSKLEEKVSEKGIDPKMLKKLMEHHSTIAKNEMSELVNELTSNAQNQQYAKQLDNDETQLKAKINDLKWQRYNLEKLSDISLEKTDDLIEDDNLLEKVQILEDEIFLNEVDLLNIQIKKLALAKVSEITQQPEIVEDLFEDALLSFPDILLEQEKFIEDMSQVSIKSPETQKLSEIQQISEKTKELENITNLKEHIAAVTKDEITEIAKELTNQAKDDSYAKKLESEDTNLKTKLNDLRWQRYNLEHSIKIRSQQTDNKTEIDQDSLEKLNQLEQEISLNETKLLENQIKIMALAQVAEIRDESENIEKLFEDALLTLPNVLVEKENLLSQSIPTVIETLQSLQEVKTEIQAEVSIEKDSEKVNDKPAIVKKISIEEEKIQKQSNDKEKKEIVEAEDKKLIEKTKESIINKKEEKEAEEDSNKEKVKLKEQEKIESKSIETTKTGDEKQEKTLDSKKKEKEVNKKQEEVRSKEAVKEEVLEEKEQKNKETTKFSDDLKEKINEQKEIDKIKGKDVKEEDAKETKEDKIEEDKLVDNKQQKLLGEKEDKKIEVTGDEEKKGKEVSQKKGDKTKTEISDQNLETKATIGKQELVENVNKGKIEDKVIEKKEVEMVEEKIKEKLEDKSKKEAGTEKKEQIIESTSVDKEKEKVIEETQEKLEKKAVDKKEKLVKEKREEKVSEKAVKAKDVDINIEAHKGEISEVTNKEILIKLQEYNDNMTQNEKHEIAKELALNATDEEYCKQLIADEEKLRAKINDLKWQRYNLEKLSYVVLEQVDNIPDNDTMLDKLHVLAEEISLNEATLQNIQIKKLALAKVAEIADKHENLEDLFEDCLLNMPTILQEDKIQLVNEPTIISTIISQFQKVKEEQISVTPLKAVQGKTTSLSPEKEIEQKLDSIMKLKEYLTSVTQDEVAEIVEELKSNSSNEDYAEQLEIEETQYKANINELKIQKHNLEESSSIIFEKTENIELEDLLLEKANILEHQITQNEAKLLNTQVKKLALAKVNEIADVVENIEGLIEDVVLSIPAILLEEEHILQNVIKVETPLVKTEVAVSKIETPLLKTEVPVSKPLETLVESEKQITSEDIEQLNVHYGSITSAKIAEFVKEWQTDNDEIAYANRIITEEKQLIAAINEIKAHKVLLESISTSQNGNSEDLENKRNLEQITILEQEELLLNNRLKDNQIKKIAIANVYVESNEEEEKVELLKKIFLNMLNILKEKGGKLKDKSQNDSELRTGEETIKLGESLLIDSEVKKEEVETQEQELKKEAVQTKKNLTEAGIGSKVAEEKSADEDEQLDKAKTKDGQSKLQSKTESEIGTEALKQEVSGLEEKLEKIDEKELASKTKETKATDSKDTDKQKQEEVLEKKKEKRKLKKSEGKDEKKSEDSTKSDEDMKEKVTNEHVKESTKIDIQITKEQKEKVGEKELEKSNQKDESMEEVIEKKEQNQTKVSTEEEHKKDTEEGKNNEEKDAKMKIKETSIGEKVKKSDKSHDKEPKELDTSKIEQNKNQEVKKKVEEATEVQDDKKEVQGNKEETEKIKKSSIEVKINEEKDKKGVALEEKQKVESIEKQQEAPNKLLGQKEEAEQVSSKISDEKKKDIQELQPEVKKGESSAKENKEKDNKHEKEVKTQSELVEKTPVEDTKHKSLSEFSDGKEDRKEEKPSPEPAIEKKGEITDKPSVFEITDNTKVTVSSESTDGNKEVTKDKTSEFIDEKEAETKVKTPSELADEEKGTTKDKTSPKHEVEKKEGTSKPTDKMKKEEARDITLSEPTVEKKVEEFTKSVDEKKEETKAKKSSELLEKKKKDETKDKTETLVEDKEKIKLESSPTLVDEKKEETKAKISPEPIEEKLKEKKEAKSKSSTELIVEKKEETKVEQAPTIPDEKKEEAKAKISPEPTEEKLKEKKESKDKSSTEPLVEKKEETKVEQAPTIPDEKKEEAKAKISSEPTEEKLKEKKESKDKSSTEPLVEKKEETKVEQAPTIPDEKKEEAKAKISSEPTEEKLKEKKDVKDKSLTDPVVEKKEETIVEQAPTIPDEKKEEAKAKISSEPTEEKLKEKKESKDKSSTERLVEKKEETKVEKAPTIPDEKKEEAKAKISSESTEEKLKEKKDVKDKSLTDPVVEKKEEMKIEQAPKIPEENKEEAKAKISPESTVEKLKEKKKSKDKSSTESLVEKEEETKVEQATTIPDENKEEAKAKISPESTEENLKEKKESKGQSSTEPVVEKKEETKVEQAPTIPDEKKEEGKAKISPEHTEEKLKEKKEVKEKPSTEPVVEKKEETKVKQAPKISEENKEDAKPKMSPEPTEEKLKYKKAAKGKSSTEPLVEKKEEAKVEQAPTIPDEKKKEAKAKISSEPTEEKLKEKKDVKDKSLTGPVVEKKEEMKIEPSPKLVGGKKEETKVKTSPEPTEETKPIVNTTQEAKEKISLESTEEKEQAKDKVLTKPIVEKKEETVVESSPELAGEKKKETKVNTSLVATEKNNEEITDISLNEPVVEKKDEVKAKISPEPPKEKLKEKKEAKDQLLPESVVEKKEETKIKLSHDEKKKETTAKTSSEPTEGKKREMEEVKDKSSTEPVVEKKKEAINKISPEPTEEKKIEKKEAKDKSSSEPVLEKKQETKVELSSKHVDEKKEREMKETKDKSSSKEPIDEKTDDVKAKISLEPTEENKKEMNKAKDKLSFETVVEKKEETKIEPSPKLVGEKKEEEKAKLSLEPTEEKTRGKKVAEDKLPLESIVENNKEKKEANDKSLKEPVVEKKEETKVEPSSKIVDEKKEEIKVKTSPESTEDSNKEKKEVKDKALQEPVVQKKEETKVEPSPKLVDVKKDETKVKTSPESTEENNKEKKQAKDSSLQEPVVEKKEKTKVEPSSKLVDEKKEETEVKTSPESTEENKKGNKEAKNKSLREPVVQKKEETKVEPSPKLVDEKKDETKVKTSPESTEENNKEKKEAKDKSLQEPLVEKKEETKVEPSSKIVDEKKDKTKVKTSPESTEENNKEKKEAKDKSLQEPIVEKKEKTKVEPSSKLVDEKKEETEVKTSPESTEENKKGNKEAKNKSLKEPVIEKKEEMKVEPSPKIADEKKGETKVKKSPDATEKKTGEVKEKPSNDLAAVKKAEAKGEASVEPTEENKKGKKETKEKALKDPAVEKKEETKVEPSPKLDEKKEQAKAQVSPETTEENKKEKKEAKVKSTDATEKSKESKLNIPPEATQEMKKVEEINSKSSIIPDVDNKQGTKAKSPPKSKSKSPPKSSEEKKGEKKNKMSEMKDEIKSSSISKKEDRDNEPKVANDDSKHSKTLGDNKKEDKETIVENKKGSKSSISSKLEENVSSLDKKGKYSQKETVVQKEEEKLSKFGTTKRIMEDANTRQLIKDTTQKDSLKDNSNISIKDQRLGTEDKVQSYTSRSTYRQMSNVETDKKAGIMLGRDRKTIETHEKDIEISNKRFGAVPKRIEPSKDISRLKVETPTSNWESRNIPLSTRQISPSRYHNKYDNIIKDTEISRSFKNADEIKKGYKTIISDYQTGSEVLKQEKQLLSSLSDHSKSISLISTVSPKSYNVEPLLFARNRPKSKYNCNLYSHENSDNFYQALRDTRKTHDRIRNLISLSESVTNSLISTNTFTYSDYEKRSRKHRHAIRATLQISKYKPSIDLNYYDGYNRISQIDRTMDFEPYYDHYFKLPMMYAVYKSNIERSYLYPRRYEVTLYCGFLRRHETIVRGYNRYKYGGQSYPKIIKHDADESFNLNAVKFSCYEKCHSYETCRHQPDARSLVNTTKGKLVLGQKGYMEVCPLRSQYRSVKWRSPDSDKYLKGDAGTDTITTRVRSSLVFVSVKPKTLANTDHDIPKIETLRTCTSTSKHSSYYPRLQKSSTIFITQPDSLISVAPGQDITVSFEINPDSNAKVNWTKRSMDVTKNPRFRAETMGNVTKYILRNSNHDDMGTYCLCAENNYSTSKAFVTVTIDNNCIYKNTTYYKLLKRHNLPSIGSIRTMPTYSKLQDMQLSTYKPTNVITSYSMVPPIFYTLPHNTVAEIGESARFQVTVGGYPSPTVTWTKDGLVIGCKPKTRIIEKFNTKVLEVALTTPEDAGTYTITIQNEAGRASASARLDIITMKNKHYSLRN